MRQLSRAHGLGRIEVANLPMVAVTADWCGDAEHALPVALEAIEAAQRVGDARAELLANDCVHFIYRARGEFARSRDHGDQALDIARRLGALRFEAELLAFTGHLDYLEGRPAEGLEKARAGLAIIQGSDTGMRFMGPSMLGLLMLTTDDTAERQGACDQAESLLAAGAVSHNHMYFRMAAIEASLKVGDHDEAERHGRALADFCAEEGLLLIEFLAARGIALARVDRGERSSELASEINRLIADGERMHQKIWLDALCHARDMLAATA